MTVILTIVVVIIVVGVIAALIDLIPIDARYRRAAQMLLIAAVILWILATVFGADLPRGLRLR